MALRRSLGGDESGGAGEAHSGPAGRQPLAPSLRASLTTLATAVVVMVALSLLAAAGLPASRMVRVAVLAVAWAALAALLAHLFLPDFDLRLFPTGARVLRRVPRRLGSRAIALTFDDGPHPETTPALLAALAREGVKATFFLVGRQARRWPELARRIVAEGHAIGNHTERHRLLVFRTRAQVTSEIDQCQETLGGLLGQRPRLFRPPHGFKPIGLRPALARHGLRMVGWQGTLRDTDAPGAPEIVRRAIAALRPRRILLLHDNPSTGGQTAQAVGPIVAACRARGLEPVALSDE